MAVSLSAFLLKPRKLSNVNGWRESILFCPECPEIHGKSLSAVFYDLGYQM